MSSGCKLLIGAQESLDQKVMHATGISVVDRRKSKVAE
jgi:hypothetical protein